ncbi:MAG: hypothetical protein J2O49_05535 [Sciscionella sp.]|nr:hypothetical protein [Sciscionella sp.]
MKKPATNVERIACLGYYLTHYRDTPAFKTNQITRLNTEAAERKFTHPARDVDNADRHNGFIVSAGKGMKQMTSRGDALVEALPDRERVKRALADFPHRRPKTSATSTKKSTTDPEDEK